MTVDVTEVGLAPLPYSVQGEKLMHQAVLYTAVAQDLANVAQTQTQTIGLDSDGQK